MFPSSFYHLYDLFDFSTRLRIGIATPRAPSGSLAELSPIIGLRQELASAGSACLSDFKA